MKNFKFAQFLQDDKGNFSSTRLAFLVWTTALLVVWTTATVQHGYTLQAIPESVILIIGAFMTGKVAQKFAENSDATVAKSDAASEPNLMAGSVQKPTAAKRPEFVTNGNAN